MRNYDINDYAYLSLIISEVFVDFANVREKSYRQVLSCLKISYKDLVEKLYEDLDYNDLEIIAGKIKDLVTWSDEDLSKVEQYMLSDNADLNTRIVEVIA